MTFLEPFEPEKWEGEAPAEPPGYVSKRQCFENVSAASTLVPSETGPRHRTAAVSDKNSATRISLNIWSVTLLRSVVGLVTLESIMSIRASSWLCASELKEC